tara:strand:- start:134 stop:352 length:219 start_codon:yes stop_codon:yes gene_type:complete
MDKQGYKQQLGNLIAENGKLKQLVLELTMERDELKDKLVNYGYAPVDGLEVGNPEDYEDNPQMELFPPTNDA